MLRKKATLYGFRVNYGKERNIQNYRANIYDGYSNSYFKPIVRISGCETEKEILLRIGFEVGILVLNEVDPNESFKGETLELTN